MCSWLAMTLYESSCDHMIVPAARYEIDLVVMLILVVFKDLDIVVGFLVFAIEVHCLNICCLVILRT